ncbi:MAG: hypothetical protein COV67_03080 [Nitrospinae bacterium CG11_big_fil_rev_8_21_14_0_20_56_8]|nr:MAG: hypothetical protein COV67_03080 [Nitrospinae bacterium CG11_big_fil_rev_8_21_14_0_20_56_8]
MGRDSFQRTHFSPPRIKRKFHWPSVQVSMANTLPIYYKNFNILFQLIGIFFQFFNLFKISS